MKKTFAIAAAIALLCLSNIGHADVFNLGEGFTNLETVAVGDPGNVGELSGLGEAYSTPDRICGSVSYNYNIGKYEVTAAQYTDFLNKVAKTDTYGLYNTDMWGIVTCNIKRSGTSGNYSYSVASDWANRPVSNVSYWDCCRFANWLGNGQPTGLQDVSTTERGAYTLDGYNGNDGRTIQRNAGWAWAVTSEDEWYKAAYYKGGGTNSGYWDYPTKSDSVPSNDLITPDPGNNACFGGTDWTIGAPYFRTNVGEFKNSASAYGTYDQGGNVWEWNEALVYANSGYAYRGLRGGSFDCEGDKFLRASARNDHAMTDDAYSIGFRVVQAVPEPSSIIALAGGLVGLLGIKRRRA